MVISANQRRTHRHAERVNEEQTNDNQQRQDEVPLFHVVSDKTVGILRLPPQC